MTIAEDLTGFQTTKSSYDTKYTSTTIPGITSLIGNLQAYIRSGGANINNENDPLYKAAHDSWTTLIADLRNWQLLNKSLAASLQTHANSGSTTSSLNTIGQTQGTVQNLQETLEQHLQDLDISQSRQLSIVDAESDQSYLQGFSGKIGFLHPIKPTSVALLLGLAFFIFFICAVILRDFFTTSAEAAAQFISFGEIMEYTGSTTFRYVLLGTILTFFLYGIGLYIYFYVVHGSLL